MARREHPKSDLYRQERENGFTYKEIAEKYGITYQCVAQACGKQSIPHFRYNETCIFPALRDWMNDNKCNASEILRKMGLTHHGSNYCRMTNLLTGRVELKKKEIDFFLKLTGMTYEELFREEEDGQQE